MANKLENLLRFEDFEKNWKAKDPKKTKRTETGLDIVEEKKETDTYIKSNAKSKKEFLDTLGDSFDKEIVDDDEVVDDEIVEDEPIEEVEDSEEDNAEDQDWQEQLKSLIDSIIEDGEEAEEVFDYIESLEHEYGAEEDDEEEGEEVSDDEDDEVVDDEDVELIADDDEGEGIGESVKSFKNWKK